jgi:hypothetical protein
MRLRPCLHQSPHCRVQLQVERNDHRRSGDESVPIDLACFLNAALAVVVLQVESKQEEYRRKRGRKDKKHVSL